MSDYHHFLLCFLARFGCSNATGANHDYRRHQPVRKRQIALLREEGNTQEALEELITLVDTWYGDAEGWLELADIYAENAPVSSTSPSSSSLLLRSRRLRLIRVEWSRVESQLVRLAPGW